MSDSAREPGPVFRAHLAELTELQQVNTADAVLVLALCDAIDARAFGLNLPATAKQCHELMQAVRAKAVPREGSTSDDLRAKRAARRRVSAS